MSPSQFDGVTRDVFHWALDAIHRREFPIVIGGNPGVGKSVAVAAIARLYSPMAWFEADRLLDWCAQLRMGAPIEVIDSFGRDRTLTMQTVNRGVESAPLVVLDDLLQRRDTSESKMSDLLNALNLRHQKPLIITTNRTSEELKTGLSPAVLSRLFAGAARFFFGPDRRTEHHRKPPQGGPK